MAYVLGEFETLILLAVMHLDGEAYPPSIRDEIGAYFRRYKEDEPGKFSKVPGWGSVADGREHVTTTHAFFLKCRKLAGSPCAVTD